MLASEDVEGASFRVCVLVRPSETAGRFLCGMVVRYGMPPRCFEVENTSCLTALGSSVECGTFRVQARVSGPPAVEPSLPAATVLFGCTSNIHDDQRQNRNVRVQVYKSDADVLCPPLQLLAHACSGTALAVYGSHPCC